MNQNSNEELAILVNEKFGLNLTAPKLANYLWLRKLRRSSPNRQRVERKEEKIDGQDIRKRKYPKEMKEFIESHMETNSNQALVDLINKKWDVKIVMLALKNYMQNYNLKRINIIRTPRRKKEEIEVEKKKVGKPKKYTDEAVQFLRENINNFSNKELCEELESQFNIKTHPDTLQQTMSNQGIKRDSKTETVDQEIVDFILNSKTKDGYNLKDEIITKFEKDIPVRKIINIMDQRKENLPGERVSDEVERITQQREEFEGDENIDEMGLD
ncbi:hypothetical protein ES703_78822 [subsurface metagenome]